MVNIEESKAKNYFKGLRYDDFEFFANNTCEYYQKKYAFLGIKKERWEKLFLKIIKRHLGSKDIEHLVTMEIIQIVKKTVDARFQDDTINLIDRLLRQLFETFKSPVTLLQNFARALEEYDIQLSEETYKELKEKSPFFKYILNSIGILSFNKNEYDAFLAGKYQIYLEIKSNKIKLLDCVRLANYFFSLSGVSKKSLDNFTFDISETLKEKVKFLIRNYSQLQEMYQTYIQTNPYVEKREYDKRVLSYDIAKIKNIFEQYTYNKYKNDVDYDTITKKYSNLTFEEIKELYGEDFSSLPSNIQKLLERYFTTIVDDKFWHIEYETEKELNLLIYGFKRKSITLDIKTLKSVYLANKDKFNPEQSLYLECFVFGIEDKSVFKSKYPNSRHIVCSQLITRLEVLYYGIDNMFSSNLTKAQYLEVLKEYPDELNQLSRAILDDYYGIDTQTLSIKELSIKYKKSYEEMHAIIYQLKLLCLSLYCNLNKEQSINKNIYIPYVLDERYKINKDSREALKLYLIDGLSYEEISKRIKKEAYKAIFTGLEKIDFYRFGIERIEPNIPVEDVSISEAEILEEIQRHPIDSVITPEEKKLLSYYLGLKSQYNPEGVKFIGKDLREKLGLNKHPSEKYKAALKKIKQRKVGILTPEYIYIPREKLSVILADKHLPISLEDREIICSLLEINNFPFKNFAELAKQFNVNEATIRRKYRIAIININKYLLGEKEGTIDYETDIVPNLKYFTVKERELIYDYYVCNLTNKEISQKYGLPIYKVKQIMYRIKTYLAELIKNPEVKRFDYDYYHEVVDKPNFPFRGDLEQAKRIFDLYAGESNFGRMNNQEIKEKLGLNMDSHTISKIIESLVLAVFKYQDGIRKENSFTLEEIKSFYRINKDNLTKEEITLFSSFFHKQLGLDFKVSENLIFVLLRYKYPEYFRIKNSPKKQTIDMIQKYHKRLSKSSRNTLMHYANISERELMNGQDKKHVLRTLCELHRKTINKKAGFRGYSL